MDSRQVLAFKNFKVTDWPRINKIVYYITERLNTGRMLDVGYREGGVADYLVNKGWSCMGIDISTSSSLKPIRMICGDINNGLPYGSSTFDLIVAGEVMEHLYDDIEFLSECKRILKPGGCLILTVPNLSYLVNRILILCGKLPRFSWAPYHYHFYNRNYLGELLLSAGFSVLKISSSHILYSRRLHSSGRIFELLGDLLPSFGAHLIVYAEKVLPDKRAELP